MTPCVPWLAAAAVIALGGCSSDSKPTVLPPLASRSATPSAVAALPSPLPAAARVHDAFGAAAFVHFYFAQVSKAYAAGDPHLVDGLADPLCGTCAAFRAAAAELAQRGEHIDGIALRLISAEATPAQGGYVVVDTYFDAPARSLVGRDAKVIKVLPADTRSHRATYIQATATGWVVRAIKKQP